MKPMLLPFALLLALAAFPAAAQDPIGPDSPAVTGNPFGEEDEVPSAPDMGQSLMPSGGLQIPLGDDTIEEVNREVLGEDEGERRPE